MNVLRELKERRESILKMLRVSDVEPGPWGRELETRDRKIAELERGTTSDYQKHDGRTWQRVDT